MITKNYIFNALYKKHADACYSKLGFIFKEYFDQNRKKHADACYSKLGFIFKEYFDQNLIWSSTHLRAFWDKTIIYVEVKEFSCPC